MPGHAHLATRVAGFEQPHQLVFAAFVERLVGLGQQASGPVERVVFAAPVTDGLVLHSAAALVELGAGMLHGVERIRDLDRSGRLSL